MFAWLVVTVKPVVPTRAVVQLTPPEPVKPGSPLQAPAEYALKSTKYASSAVAALRASDATRALKPRDRYAENCGIAIAARMPMMATTTSSSISVKPLDFFRFILETLRILSPFWLDGFWSCLDPSRDALGRCRALEASEVPRGERTAWRDDGAKSRRFAARTDGAASRLDVRACPPIGTKLTPGTIPSPPQRKAHIERRLESGARWSAGGETARRCGRAIQRCSCCNRIAR